jgi:hypothetical protein
MGHIRGSLVASLLVISVGCGGRQPRDQLYAHANDGRIADVAALLDAGQVDVNAAAPNHGGTALMQAAGNGQVEMIKYLVSRGAVIDQVDASGVTALMYACWGHQVAAVQVLLQLGADRNRRAGNGWDCRMHAAPEHAMGPAVSMANWNTINGMLDTVAALPPDAPERQANVAAAPAAGAGIRASSDDGRAQAESAHMAFLGGGISYGGDRGGLGISTAAFVFGEADAPGLARFYMRGTLSNAAGITIGAGMRAFGRTTLGFRAERVNATPEGSSGAEPGEHLGGELGYLLRHSRSSVIHPIVFVETERLGVEAHLLQSLFTYARPDRQSWRVSAYGSVGFGSSSVSGERVNEPYLTLGLIVLDVAP